MTKKFITICLILLTTFPLIAENVNVINSDPNVSIILNGNNYNSNKVFNLDLVPGTHYIELQKNGTNIYENTFTVQKNNALTLNTDSFVKNNNQIQKTDSTKLNSNTITQKGTLNIISPEKNAKIYINDKKFDTNMLFNLDLDTGTHLVRIMEKNKLLFKEIITIKEDEVTTIDTSDKYSNEPKSIQKRKLKALKKKRGSFGLGFQLQSISGISIKKYFGPIGIQFVGYTLNGYQDDIIYNNTTYKDEDYGYSIRVLLNLKEKLGLKNTPVRLYTGLGYGVDTYDYHNSLNDDIYFNKNVLISTYLQTFVGIEYDTRHGSYSFGIEYRIKETTGKSIDDYWYYNSYSNNELIDIDIEDNGMAFNAGYHYYF